MRRLIPYAGYDPQEDDYSTIDLEPEFPWLWSNENKAHRQEGIDVRRAIELRSTGLKWREVADVLTNETGRMIRFCGDSVSGAVWRVNKGARL